MSATVKDARSSEDIINKRVSEMGSGTVINQSKHQLGCTYKRGLVKCTEYRVPGYYPNNLFRAHRAACCRDMHQGSCSFVCETAERQAFEKHEQSALY